jgi:hypothetical protein
LIIFFASIPALGSLFWSSIQAYETNIRQANDNLLRLSELAATGQNKVLHGIHNQLITISKTPAVHRFEHPACQVYLASLLSDFLKYQPLRGYFARADCQVMMPQAKCSIAK